MKETLTFLGLIVVALMMTACPDPTTTPTDEVVSIAAIPGVTAPAYGETPVTAITETAQYTGTVSWSPTASGTFAAETAYTATITLTAKSGYTLSGISANFFSVDGATSVSNDADSGVLTAVFPETAYTFTGDTETFTADSVSFIMTYIPGGLTFSTGVDDDGSGTVEDAFWIADTEVTYELWAKVYTCKWKVLFPHLRKIEFLHC